MGSNWKACPSALRTCHASAEEAAAAARVDEPRMLRCTRLLVNSCSGDALP